MDEKLRKSILDRLKVDYQFTSTGHNARRWSGGRCPSCGGKELYVYTDTPWTVSCGRENRCGEKWNVKDLYDDLFNNWSDKHPQTPEDPHAAAKAYLRDSRGLNVALLGGHFSQETYHDRHLNATSATVRFPMPDDGWWERLIDQPQRFGKKKANFKYGYKYRGHAWHNPNHSWEELAKAKEIWFAEGIFDAAAFEEAFRTSRPAAFAAATMSTNNYPEIWLDQLAQAVADLGKHAVRPKLVFAFDVGAAGVRWTREYVKKAKDNGWQACAAQVRPDGEGNKLDWNDLLQRDRLKAEDLEFYLGNGDITIAETAAEKAYLLYKRHQRASFPFTFKTRQLWATFSADQINQKVAQYDDEGTHKELKQQERYDLAARECAQVQEIANCTFKTLYFQRDAAINEASYYVRVDFPTKQDSVKAAFAGPCMAGSGEFKKRLISVAPGAIFTGSTQQLDKLMARQLENIRTVDMLYFSGYSIEHKAWMFDDIAVTAGRLIELNDEDFFEIGKIGVKPKETGREFAIKYDAHRLNYSWWPDLWDAFGALGLVTLAYNFLSLFAEQIRRDQQSLGFLEVAGPPGSGKSTLIIFIWKLLGRRHNYEGFDPASATAAGIARELVKFGNLPVVLLEGDRKKDQPAAKKFDWSELKKIYNGHSPRTRGVANGGTDTFSPPFRGSLVIAQNDPVRDAEDAVLERIMPLFVDKSRFSEKGKAAGKRLQRYEVEDVSHWMIAMIRQEKSILDLYAERFAFWENALFNHPEVQNDRLAFNHAQLAAALDCMFKAMHIDGKPTITEEQREAGQRQILGMCLLQHGALGADHPAVAAFWESFDHLETKLTAGSTLLEGGSLNHSRKADVGIIALSMPEIEQVFAQNRISIPAGSMLELKKLLPTSKARKFIGKQQVNCVDGKNRHCWVFQKSTFDLEQKS